MEQINKRLMNWASILDEKTREQALTTSSMPFIHPHLALMPDAHLGKGATVGSVIPTLGVIMPAAVGVDIGCGMIAVRTSLTEDELPPNRRPVQPGDRKALREAIEWAIPLSAGRYNNKIVATAEPKIAELEQLASGVGMEHAVADWFTGDGKGLDAFVPNWRKQLGSLGSGNHFIEVTVDEEQRVWLFLHSGSRGVGNKLAVHHIAVAQEYCKRHWIDLPDRDLAYLVEGTLEFDEYLTDLQWAQRFAFLNREEMMDRVIRQFTEWVGSQWVETERINCHHNYSSHEKHFGKEVWLSRKGAIDAHAGTPGLIPGSMGTASYVVVGRGNPLALNSSPHGAGREYSRSAARKTFTFEQLQENMKGIEWNPSKAFLDEIPAAYKDVDVVMADAADLVEIKHTLHQIVSVKGD
jgi:tRNA-splicing ligase RtcB